MEYKITISGSGTSSAISKALFVAAQEIKNGDHEISLKENPLCEWEDETLFVTIYELEEEEDE